MENSDLHNLWQGAVQGQQIKTGDELAGIIDSKAKKTANRFLFTTAVSGGISIGVIAFLTITAMNRTGDFFYILNNITLGIITVISLGSAIYSWRNLQNNRYSMSLKKWLETDIAMISKSLKGKLSKVYIIVIPVIYILLILSINIYYSNKMYIDIFQSEDSVIALIIGTIIGLSVSFYVERKIRRYHLKNLNTLEELHRQITDFE